MIRINVPHRLPNRGVRDTERLYSLDPSNNGARYRVLLELGDNLFDLKFLQSPRGRQEMADAVVSVLRSFVAEHYLRTTRRPFHVVDPRAEVHTDPRIVLAQEHLGPLPPAPWRGF